MTADAAAAGTGNAARRNALKPPRGLTLVTRLVARLIGYRESGCVASEYA